MGKAIKVGDETYVSLTKLKLVDREPMDSVIQRLLKVNENVKGA
jgi:predicted CopG family antitoxin